jgi:HEPN domain-containing protein
MPSPLPEPGSPEDWLRFAKSDLALSQMIDAPDVLLETLCFHAQQATEKSIKAVLVFCGVPFERTHNIKSLIEKLPPEYALTDEISAAALTEYAVAMRYPGEREVIEIEEYQSAVAVAQAVYDWANGIVAAR